MLAEASCGWPPRLIWRRRSLGMRSGRSRRLALIPPLELVDVRLLDYGHVLCPAGDHEHSLLVDPMDIVRLTGARSVEVRQD